MKTMKVIVRYISGREEQFEVEMYGATGAELRLKEFVQESNMVLQTDKEVIVIPSTAVECVTLLFPEGVGKELALPNVRKGKRLK